VFISTQKCVSHLSITPRHSGRKRKKISRGFAPEKRRYTHIWFSHEQPLRKKQEKKLFEKKMQKKQRTRKNTLFLRENKRRKNENKEEMRK
jgi:hypothetical protein